MGDLATRLGRAVHAGQQAPSSVRHLLRWYVEDVRGLFRDDPEHSLAPLFPSERLPPAVAALNMPIAPAVVPARRSARRFCEWLSKSRATQLTGPGGA